MTTTAQKEALASNVTFCTLSPIIKVTAKDGTVIAYIPHTRYLTIGGTLYAPYSPADISRPTVKVGLEPDSIEFTASFDDVITKAGVIGGKWRGARGYTAHVVDYRDVTTYGVVQERNWFVGNIKCEGNSFTMELLSLSQALTQQIGDVTSPIDRNRTPEETGVDMTPFTHAATVTTPAPSDRRIFTVSVSKASSYFRYGRAEWATGANAGRKMEIEDNTGTLITLQLPMPSNIAVGDTLTLYAGYDSTREQARDKFGSPAMENFQGEPDLPGLNKTLTYPS